MLEQYRQGSDSTIFKIDMPNHSAAKVSIALKQAYSRTSTFSWGLHENLRIFASVKTQFGIPLVASGELEVGLEGEIGSDQQWTESNTRSDAIVETVVAKPYTNVKVVAYTTAIQNLPLPFTAEMRVNFVDDYDFNNHEYNQCLLTQLKYRGYTDIEKLSDDDERGVTIMVRGDFKGTFGFTGILGLEDVLLKSSRFNRYDQKRSKVAMCNRIR